MAKFSREQIESQICTYLEREGYSEAVAKSAALKGAQHYVDSPNATLTSSITWAKTHAKTMKRVKDKPDRPHVPGRRTHRRV